MKTFSFPHLSPLRDFQFLTDSSEFVLIMQTDQLHHFTGQKAELVAIPGKFAISHFHFLDQTRWAVIVSACQLPSSLQKSAFSVAQSNPRTRPSSPKR
jgi:hypothetical protein